jgi:hypothetical protein
LKKKKLVLINKIIQNSPNTTFISFSLYFQGLLKYVPIVGSVVNWFYPTSPTGITGRIFDLSSGKVETSSKVYQKRMQLIEEETQQVKENKEQEMVAPSTPVQQNNSSETHSQSDDNK